MLGLGLVSIYKTNMTVNGLTLAQGEALFQNGMKNTSTFTITIMLCIAVSKLILIQWDTFGAV